MVLESSRKRSQSALAQPTFFPSLKRFKIDRRPRRELQQEGHGPSAGTVPVQPLPSNSPTLVGSATNSSSESLHPTSSQDPSSVASSSRADLLSEPNTNFPLHSLTGAALSSRSSDASSSNSDSISLDIHHRDHFNQPREGSRNLGDTNSESSLSVSSFFSVPSGPVSDLTSSSGPSSGSPSSTSNPSLSIDPDPSISSSSESSDDTASLDTTSHLNTYISRRSASQPALTAQNLGVLQSRLTAFLPALHAANQDLEQERVEGTLAQRDIENVQGDAYIEMDLGLGVLESRPREIRTRHQDEDDEDEDEDNTESDRERQHSYGRGTRGEEDVMRTLLGHSRPGPKMGNPGIEILL